MLKSDRLKLETIVPELMTLVAAHEHEAAFLLFEKTLGSCDSRGWGWPMAPTVDLMRRIVAICPGDDGVTVAVTMALCGDSTHDSRRLILVRARYEQDLDEARRCGFVKGVQIAPGYSPCSAASEICGCYLLADAPSFPPKFCTSENGCVCGWLNIFDGEEPSTPWRV